MGNPFSAFETSPGPVSAGMRQRRSTDLNNNNNDNNKKAPVALALLENDDPIGAGPIQKTDVFKHLLVRVKHSQIDPSSSSPNQLLDLCKICRHALLNIPVPEECDSSEMVSGGCYKVPKSQHEEDDDEGELVFSNFASKHFASHHKNLSVGQILAWVNAAPEQQQQQQQQQQPTPVSATAAAGGDGQQQQQQQPALTPPPPPHATYFLAARCLRNELTVESMQGKHAHLFNLAGFTPESESKVKQDARNNWENIGKEWENFRQVRVLGKTQEEKQLLAALSYEHLSVFFKSKKLCASAVEFDVFNKLYKFYNFTQCPELENEYIRKMGFILAHLMALIYWHPTSRYYQDAERRATRNFEVELDPLLLDPVVPCAICGKGVPYPEASLDAQEDYAPHLPSTVGVTHLHCNTAKKSIGFGETAAFIFHYTARARDLALTTDTEQSSQCFEFNFSDFAAVYDNVERHRNDITVEIHKERRYDGKFQGFGMSLLDLLLDEKIPFTVDYKTLDDAITHKNHAPETFPRLPGERQQDTNKRFKKERQAKCADTAGRIWNEDRDSEHCSIFSFVSIYDNIKTIKSRWEGFGDPTVVLDPKVLPVPKSDVATQRATFKEVAGDSSIGDTQSNALFNANDKMCGTPGGKYVKYWDGEDGPSREDALKHALFFFVNIWLLNKFLQFTCLVCGQKDRVFAGGDRGDCDAAYFNLFNVFPVCYACNTFRRRFWEIRTLCVLYDLLAEYKKFKAGMEWYSVLPVPVASSFSASAESLNLGYRAMSVADHLASGEFAGITMEQVNEHLYGKLTFFALQTDAAKEKGAAAKKRQIDGVGKETVNCPCCDESMPAEELKSHVEDKKDKVHKWYHSRASDGKEHGGTLGALRRTYLGSFYRTGFSKSKKAQKTYRQIQAIKKKLTPTKAKVKTPWRKKGKKEVKK